jgi:hypothetical protein
MTSFRTAMGVLLFNAAFFKTYLAWLWTKIAWM